MFTVKLVGGAKKSFSTDKLQIDKSDITIKDLIDLLLELKPARLPELDTKNILVAVNGVDSSAMQGRQSLVREGDLVSIIPVIHGGADTHAQKPERLIIKASRHMQVVRIRAQKNIDGKFLDDLRQRYPLIRIQAVSAKFAASIPHIQKILRLSLEAEKNDILLSNKLEMDILMRFTLTGQISKAISVAGIRTGTDFMLIAVGDGRVSGRLYRELYGILAQELFPKKSSMPFLKKHFGITKQHLDSVHSILPLEDILTERAAVLFI